ncbi:hypothetical protein AERO9AM_10364 [Aeromicrobium sp. 9AM]|nr:hypothetical protein AERO9AM_10364 [Aeromicrobium sp. 9AM]
MRQELKHMVDFIRFVEKMCNHNHGSSGFAPSTHLAPEVRVTTPVKTLVGLVKEQQFGSTQLSENQVQFLLSSTGELRHRLLRPRSPSQPRRKTFTRRTRSAPTNSRRSPKQLEMLLSAQQIVCSTGLRHPSHVWHSLYFSFAGVLEPRANFQQC